MPSLPALDVKTQINHSPHVVILGAGASLASFSDGDKNGKSLPLMNNLAKVVEIADEIKDSGLEYNSDFESFYDDLVSQNKYPKIVTKIEQKIYKYFQSLELPDDPTIYDYLVLSLREKDLIATFNWDPFLAKAFQRNRHIAKLPQIIFLHGNVEIGICKEHKRQGFINQRCSICGKNFEPTRLLYPVKHKNYSKDPFVKNEWDTFRNYLKRAYYVTIFGYGVPSADIEAKNLILEVWKGNPTLELAEIDIIDVKKREFLEETWDEFLFSHHYGIYDDIFNSYLFRHPRRSCEAFAMATLQCSPWEENNYPRFDQLKKIQDWITPLLKEEAEGKFSGDKCN